MEKQGLSPKVMIVSNQQTTGPLWVFSLQQLKLNVVLESVPANTLARCEAESPALIILDINLPETQILELIRILRAELLTPLLLLAPARSDEFILEAYEAGVDDCIPKPISHSLFQAKAKVWLRRFGSISTDVISPISAGTLQLFPAEKIVVQKNGDMVHLTNLELRLLYFLMNRAGRTVSAEELYRRVWGYSSETDTTMLKNVIYRLRRKIEADPANPQLIQTVTGAGYRFAQE
jgi:two-component system, OmpR family, KDP operon response regulator KdpE